MCSSGQQILHLSWNHLLWKKFDTFDSLSGVANYNDASMKEHKREDPITNHQASKHYKKEHMDCCCCSFSRMKNSENKMLLLL